jgi:error-prone DNA polymerase
MRKIREKFVRRAVSRGVPEGKAREVLEWMEGFSVYGFSAAHAASFASLSYASAYMRCHYPTEFFCGLLNSQPMGFYSPRVLLNEARRIGIDVLPPDIHLSGEGFTVEEYGSALRVGLKYCKGLSEKAISSIASERRKRPFASVVDLYQRTWVERDSLRNLIKGGFLDSLSDSRLRLLGEVDELPKKRIRHECQPEIPLPHPASWWSARENRSVEHLPLTQTQRERMEWETLFLNVSRHLLLPYRRVFEELGVTPSEKIRGLRHGSRVRAAGLIECLQSPPTKSGTPVWFLVIEDEWGLLQATIFRSVYHRYGHLLNQKGAFLLEGRVENTPEKGFSFLTERVHDLQEALVQASVPIQRAVSCWAASFRAGPAEG